jgi:hypothetical protein
VRTASSNARNASNGVAAALAEAGAAPAWLAQAIEVETRKMTGQNFTSVILAELIRQRQPPPAA